MMFGLPLWNWLLFFFVYVPIVILWVSVIIDVFTRRDLSGWAKVGWTVLVFVVPLLGALIYLGARPSDEAIAEQQYTKRAA